MDLNRIPKDGKSYHIVWKFNDMWWGDSVQWSEDLGKYMRYNDEADGFFGDSERLKHNDSQYYIIGIETFDIINQHYHEV